MSQLMNFLTQSRLYQLIIFLRKKGMYQSIHFRNEEAKMRDFDFIALGLTPAELALYNLQAGLSNWGKIPAEKRPFFLLTAHLFLSLNDKHEEAKKLKYLISNEIFDLYLEDRLKISESLADCQIPEFAALEGGFLCSR